MQKMGMQILWSVLYGILGGLIFLLGLNFLKSIPEKFQDIYKIGLPIPFLIMYFLSQRYLPNQKNVFWAFFLVSMGWMLDFYLTGRFKDLFSLNAKELSGFAYTMVISTLLVSLPVISGWLISNQELSTIYLQWSGGGLGDYCWPHRVFTPWRIWSLTSIRPGFGNQGNWSSNSNDVSF